MRANWFLLTSSGRKDVPRPRCVPSLFPFHFTGKQVKKGIQIRLARTLSRCAPCCMVNMAIRNFLLPGSISSVLGPE